MRSSNTGQWSARNPHPEKPMRYLDVLNLCEPDLRLHLTNRQTVFEIAGAVALVSRSTPPREAVPELLAGRVPARTSAAMTWLDSHSESEKDLVAGTAASLARAQAARLRDLADTVSCQDPEWVAVLRAEVPVREELDAVLVLLQRCRIPCSELQAALRDVDDIGREIVTITPRIPGLADHVVLRGVPGHDLDCWWGRLV